MHCILIRNFPIQNWNRMRQKVETVCRNEPLWSAKQLCQGITQVYFNMIVYGDNWAILLLYGIWLTQVSTSAYMQREQDFYDRSILIPCDDVAHTHLRKTTHTPSMLCHEWVECGHSTEWSQLASTWLEDTLYCMLHVLAYSSNKRHWIIWVVLLYFTWELNKDYTVTEDPSRYPGIGPSTIQPQHICWGRNTFVRSFRPRLGLNLSTKGIVPHSD
jgi:hypothetical protein